MATMHGTAAGVSVVGINLSFSHTLFEIFGHFQYLICESCTLSVNHVHSLISGEGREYDARVSLMSCLAEIDDLGNPSNGTLHDFWEIAAIMIAAVLLASDTVEYIVFLARKKEALLHRFLVLKNGSLSEETFLRSLRTLDPKQFGAAFRPSVGGLFGALGDVVRGGVIAIDGKTVRGSGSRGERAIQMDGAFASDVGLGLGKEKVAAKSN